MANKSNNNSFKNQLILLNGIPKTSPIVTNHTEKNMRFGYQDNSGWHSMFKLDKELSYKYRLYEQQDKTKQAIRARLYEKLQNKLSNLSKSN